jgi:hypothetical protein
MTASRRYLQIFLHISACVIFLLLPVIFSPDFDFSLRFMGVLPFQKDFLFYVLLILFFYLNIYYFLPQFYFRRRYLLYAIIVILAYAFMVWLPWALLPEHFPKRHFRPHPDMHHGRPKPMFGFWFFFFREHFYQFGLVMIISLLVKVNARWKQSEKEKINAELSFLKAQVNPHFLFNTLNSIYSLALEKSDKTAYAVVKLSGMMRYVISDANKETVSLNKELAYITDYIDLQKMRSGADVRLSYTVEGDASGKVIAPLLLIPFIENAFKHGINAEDDSDIVIRIITKEKALEMQVRNKKVSQSGALSEKSGLGIENTRSRLQLIYPFNHQLVIKDLEYEFSVYLTIDFS